jgi:hypothetical protein
LLWSHRDALLGHFSRRGEGADEFQADFRIVRVFQRSLGL